MWPVVRVSVEGGGGEGRSRGRSGTEQCITTEQQQQKRQQRPSLLLCFYTRPIARFLVGDGAL